MAETNKNKSELNIFKRIYEKLKSLKYDEIITSASASIASVAIIGIFVMATKVYSIEVELTNIRANITKKASKDWVDAKFDDTNGDVTSNVNNIKSIKDQDIKDIKDGIKELNDKFDNKVEKISDKIDQNQKFIINQLRNIYMSKSYMIDTLYFNCDVDSSTFVLY